jgi:hypothetical protein
MSRERKNGSCLVRVKRTANAMNWNLECRPGLSVQTGTVSVINSAPALYPWAVAAAAFAPSQSMMGRMRMSVIKFVL